MLLSLCGICLHYEAGGGRVPAFMPTDSPSHSQAEKQHNAMLDDCLRLRDNMGGSADLISLGTAFKMLVQDLPKVWRGALSGREGEASPPGKAAWFEVLHVRGAFDGRRAVVLLGPLRLGGGGTFGEAGAAHVSSLSEQLEDERRATELQRLRNWHTANTEFATANTVEVGDLPCVVCSLPGYDQNFITSELGEQAS